MKCPFCDSKHTARNGFDEDSMDIWKCMACGESFTQVDLDRKNGIGFSADDAADFQSFLVDKGLVHDPDED